MLPVPQCPLLNHVIQLYFLPQSEANSSGSINIQTLLFYGRCAWAHESTRLLLPILLAERTICVCASISWTGSPDRHVFYHSSSLCIHDRRVGCIIYFFWMPHSHYERIWTGDWGWIILFRCVQLGAGRNDAFAALKTCEIHSLNEVHLINKPVVNEI